MLVNEDILVKVSQERLKISLFQNKKLSLVVISLRNHRISNH